MCSTEKQFKIKKYLALYSCGTYNEDDREFFPDFLQIIHSCTKNQTNATDTPDIPNVPHHEILLERYEINILHQVAGYLIRSISRNEKFCKQCVLCTGSLRFSLLLYNRLTILRCYGNNTFFLSIKELLTFLLK